MSFIIGKKLIKKKEPEKKPMAKPADKMTDREKLMSRMPNFTEPHPLSDITIISAEGTKLYFYRICLSIHSQYFAAMFASQMKESKATEIQLPQSTDILNRILSHIFILCIKPTMASQVVLVPPITHYSQMAELIDASQFYLLFKLKNACEAHIMSQTSFFKIKAINKLFLYDLPKYKKKILDIASKDDFLKITDLGELDAHLIKELAPTRRYYYRILLVWLSCNQKNRDKLPELLTNDMLSDIEPEADKDLYFLMDFCDEKMRERIKSRLLANYISRLEIETPTPRAYTVDDEVQAFLDSIKNG